MYPSLLGYLQYSVEVVPFQHSVKSMRLRIVSVYTIYKRMFYIYSLNCLTPHLEELETKLRQKWTLGLAFSAMALLEGLKL